MKTHYPYFFIKFSKNSLNPLESVYPNGWKKNFLKNCPLKSKFFCYVKWDQTNWDDDFILAQHIRKWFMECYQRKTIFCPRPIPLSNGQTQVTQGLSQVQSQPGIAGGSTNAQIVQIPIF